MVARALAPPFVIGVDVGGTKILGGVLDRQGNVLARHEIPSPTSSEGAVLDALDGVVQKLRNERVEALGYGVPTNLDRATGKILAGVNLPLTDVDLAGHAREHFGLPVGVGNDANVAALAEGRLGAGRGTSSIVMLTLGTGVGGGVVLDGRLYRRWAELGHVVVQAGGPPCQGHCHGHGHLEAVASGTAADRIARELYGEEADAHLLLERARAGDPPAVERIAEMADLLGAAIGSFANVFDPDLFVVGEAAFDLLADRTQEAARREALEPADRTLRIVPAELGSDAGLVGAALVAFEALDGTW
jgi:glucokinase